MKTVACVLKTGQWRNRHIRVEYRPEQVRWLRDMVAAHLRTAHRFVCLTDTNVYGVDTIPLRDDLPGWWSKLEMFRELEEAFYLDLDTVIVGDITRMVKHKHRFSVLRNLSSPASGRIGSGVMAWRGDYVHLYTEFMSSPDRYMAECTTPQCWGDQGFIQKTQRAHGGWDHLQDMWPGRIKSYKFDLKRKHTPDKGVRIICFHGSPKPWETDHAWVPRMQA